MKWPRVPGFATLHELLLISAVSTILVIRTQLWLTNYPELGGHGLHIAHLLYGGVFMLVAIGLLLTFLGRPVRHAAAIVGGIGFGFFIDELGKFITQDNDYFFRPAAALIYLIFIGLFLLARAIRESDRFGVDAPLPTAVDLLAEAARGDLDESERREALAQLRRSDPDDPLVAPLRSVFEALPARPVAPPGRPARLALRARAALDRVTAWPGFPTAVARLFQVWAVTSLVAAVWRLEGGVTFLAVASLAGSLVSLVLVAARQYERALLVGIFVTQVFAFVTSQFGAVFGLGIDLALLWMLSAVRTRVYASPHAHLHPDRGGPRPRRHRRGGAAESRSAARGT